MPVMRLSRTTVVTGVPLYWAERIPVMPEWKNVESPRMAQMRPLKPAFFIPAAFPMDAPMQMVVSIAAGVTFEQLSGWLGSSSATIFRVIPNTAIEVGSGVTFVSSYNASDSQKETVVGIFGEMGYVHEVEESMMASGTALASCGIAYAMKYMKAAIEGGCELGFAEEEARDIVEHTVKGAAELLLSTGNTPQVEIEKVTTPGGMTAKGLAAMDESGFSDAVIDGLKGCLK